MIARPHLDFIVLAYPRSGTTWLANWLTTDGSLCLHDPFTAGMPDAWPGDTRLRGISCTASFLIDGWVEGYDCPIAVIERDIDECDASMAKLGLQSWVNKGALDRVDGRRFSFDSLWNEDGARALWSHLLPQIPFDALRYQQLQAMQVQPYQSKCVPDGATFRALVHGGHINLQERN